MFKVTDAKILLGHSLIKFPSKSYWNTGLWFLGFVFGFFNLSPNPIGFGFEFDILIFNLVSIDAILPSLDLLIFCLCSFVLKLGPPPPLFLFITFILIICIN